MHTDFNEDPQLRDGEDPINQETCVLDAGPNVGTVTGELLVTPLRLVFYGYPHIESFPWSQIEELTSCDDCIFEIKTAPGSRRYFFTEEPSKLPQIWRDGVATWKSINPTVRIKTLQLGLGTLRRATGIPLGKYKCRCSCLLQSWHRCGGVFR